MPPSRHPLHARHLHTAIAVASALAIGCAAANDDESGDGSSGEASRDFWVEANGCSSTTTVGDPPQCQNYEGCDPGYPVIWCPHTDDGGHQHPSFGREAVREFLASF